jgi:predicted ATP-dependent protease
VAVSAIRKVGLMECMADVGITGLMGLDGRLYGVMDYRKKIRGAAAHGVKYVIVPRESVLELPADKIKRLMEPTVNHTTGRWELTEVQAEKSVREGPDAVTVIAVDTIWELMDLLLIFNHDDPGNGWRPSLQKPISKKGGC